MQPFIDFIEMNTPPLGSILKFGPFAIAWAAVCLILAGWLKRARQWRTGYTRKVFHFLIFGSAVIIQSRWGTPAMCLFGGMTSIVILLALIRGERSLLYEAIARESDAPHRSWYVVAPYIATLIGGIVSHVYFGPGAATVGLLVTGIADAVAEPIGTRFGKHPYSVFTLTKTACTRTFEGSAAVLIAAIFSLLLATQIYPEIQLSWSVIPTVFGISMICMIVEAVSPHGWDNLTLQVVPSWLFWSWL